MKLTIRLSCLIISILLLLSACENDKGDSTMNKVFYKNYVMDDDISLEKSITKEYDLNELKSFFHDRHMNESIGGRANDLTLGFDEVNHKYPIEVVRTKGYSVYRVKQGGYYYVFWIRPLTLDVSPLDCEPVVYFSAYLCSNVESNMFDSIIPGESTAEDVKKIDPFFELSSLMSSGFYSYSYIDKETILQIEYAYQENIDGYDDLIVKEKKLVSREAVPTKYGNILSSDLP